MPSIVGPDLKVLAYRGSKEPDGTIAMPVRDTVRSETFMSLVTTVLAPGWFEQGTAVDVTMCQGNVLTMQRNQLVQRMRGDWLLFIDDDMVWHPDQLVRLIQTRDEHDLDMVGALCYRRSFPHQPTMFMRQHATSGPFNYLEDWTDGQIVEVDATGMAFVIIHKRVFERIVAEMDDRPGWEMPSYEERITMNPPNFFRWNGGFGEDLQFCIDAKRTGSRIYVDTGVEIGHVAEVEVGREHFLQGVAKRDDAMDADRRAANDSMGLPTLSRSDARGKLGW